MEFKFSVNDIFREPIVEVNQDMVPRGFTGDRRALWDAVTKVMEVVNAMGEASAKAQGLNKPITTSERLRNSNHTIYLQVDPKAANGKGVVTGMLKTGKKGLYVFDRDGTHYQLQPPCILDFYVHESRQRNGLGRQIFEHMLQKEKVDPAKLAIDRPSDKFLGFLNKHYRLNSPIKQMNNYVVFDGFFPMKAEEKVENNNGPSPKKITNKHGANGLQSGYTTPFGRYGAPRPPCSMGQIIHNQSSTMQSSPEQSGSEQTPKPTTNSQSAPAVAYSHQHSGQYQMQPSQYAPPQTEANQNINATVPQYLPQQYQQQIVEMPQSAYPPANYYPQGQQQTVYYQQGSPSVPNWPAYSQPTNVQLPHSAPALATQPQQTPVYQTIQSEPNMWPHSYPSSVPQTASYQMPQVMQSAPMINAAEPYPTQTPTYVKQVPAQVTMGGDVRSLVRPHSVGPSVGYAGQTHSNSAPSTSYGTEAVVQQQQMNYMPHVPQMTPSGDAPSQVQVLQEQRPHSGLPQQQIPVHYQPLEQQQKIEMQQAAGDYQSAQPVKQASEAAQYQASVQQQGIVPQQQALAQQQAAAQQVAQAQQQALTPQQAAAHQVAAAQQQALTPQQVAVQHAALDQQQAATQQAAIAQQQAAAQQAAAAQQQILIAQQTAAQQAALAQQQEAALVQQQAAIAQQQAAANQAAVAQQQAAHQQLNMEQTVAQHQAAQQQANMQQAMAQRPTTAVQHQVNMQEVAVQQQLAQQQVAAQQAAEQINQQQAAAQQQQQQAAVQRPVQPAAGIQTVQQDTVKQLLQQESAGRLSAKRENKPQQPVQHQQPVEHQQPVTPYTQQQAYAQQQVQSQTQHYQRPISAQQQSATPYAYQIPPELRTSESACPVHGNPYVQQQQVLPPQGNIYTQNPPCNVTPPYVPQQQQSYVPQVHVTPTEALMPPPKDPIKLFTHVQDTVLPSTVVTEHRSSSANLSRGQKHVSAYSYFDSNLGKMQYLNQEDAGYPSQKPPSASGDRNLKEKSSQYLIEYPPRSNNPPVVVEGPTVRGAMGNVPSAALHGYGDPCN